MSSVGLNARIQLQRHLRSPAIWAFALFLPLAARAFVPGEGADYALVSVNGSTMERSAAVIGLEVGMLVSVLFTPLAYIFLRAGPTRRQPRQVTDVAGGARGGVSFGQWLGDVAMLWLMVGVIGLAAIVISLFRLPADQVAPIRTLTPVLLIAAPAMAVVAAIRALLASRPALRGAGGDVAFFVLWLVLLLVSVAFYAIGGGEGGPGAAFADILGFAAPIDTAVDRPIDELTIVGPAADGSVIEVDAMSGVLTGPYLLSRAVWIVAAGLLAVVAGWLYKPARPKLQFVAAKQSAAEASFTTEPVQAVQPRSSSLLGHARQALRELATPRWLFGLLAAVAVAGIALPLRGMVGPALVLGLIFPLTRFGARWRAPATAQWEQGLPLAGERDVAVRLGIAVALCCALLLPSLIGLPADHLIDAALIGLALPVVAVGLSHLTRSAVAARLLLLIAWYAYLNAGGTPGLA